MSDRHEQSYYEIALTNRQVMSIFVVLLLAVLVAFLGGVWLGKDADTAVEMASAQSITAGVASGEAPLGELNFFSRREQPGEPAVEPVPVDPGQNQPEAPGASSAGKNGPVEESRREAVRREPADMVRDQAPGTGRDANPPPVQAAVPEPPAAETPAEPVATTPDTPVPAGVGAEVSPVPEYVVIQVFSSNDESQARRVVSRLRKAGYPAILSPVEVDSRILHRVRIGPYSDRDEAKVVAQSVERTFKLDTWITN